MTWLFYALIAAVLFSAAAILAKMGIKKADQGIGAGLSTLVMFICAFFVAGTDFSKLNIFRLGGSTIVYLLISGALTGAAVLCLFKALRDLDTVTTVSFEALNSILFLWFGVLWWNNKMGVNLIIASALCVVGIIVVIVANSKNWKMGGFALLGAILLAAASVIDEIGLSKMGESNLRLNKLLIAAIIIWIISIATGSGKRLRQISFLDGIYSCLSGLAVAGSWLLLSRGNALGNDTSVLQVYTSYLIIIAVLASFLLKEKITGKKMAGVILFVAGLEVLLLSKPLF